MPYLTKSLFKIASDCPPKLYYHVNKDVYANRSLNDPFLAELAKGGFQVGALARCYYPTGILIGKGDADNLVQITLQHLQAGDATLFEAAIAIDDYYIRVDILRKTGNQVSLIEVKAKSFAPSSDVFINKKNGEISADWREYLDDVAFQTFVLRKFVERHNMRVDITPYLMLVNKETTTDVEGLNQLFFFNRHTREVEVDPRVVKNPSYVGKNILVKLDVAQEVKRIHEEPYVEGSYEKHVKHIAEALNNNAKLSPILSKRCKTCEFRVDETSATLRDGLRECWQESAGFREKDFARKMVWDVWDFRRADDMVQANRFFLDDLTRTDLDPNGKSFAAPSGMSRIDRQEIQILKARTGDPSPHVMRDDLCREMEQWTYPLNMIDFETSAVALPFHSGMRPYDIVAFQFSHHLVHEDHRVEHKNEWLQTERGRFPNFDFIRALKTALSGYKGTIFRYSAHENTVLNAIHRQLQQSQETDREELQNFIESITCLKVKNKKEFVRIGDRCMVDLLKVVKDYYYHPLAGGSNSIKYMLPAVLNTSVYLQNKYSLPVYGTGEMPSRNFTNMKWIEQSDGAISDPYELLPPIFSKHDDEILEETIMDEDAELREGGAAMAAYAMMQFSRMSDEEAKRIRESLLRYCELDTLAMVMLYEELREQCARHR